MEKRKGFFAYRGRLLDEEGRAVFDSPEAVKAFHLIKDMVFEKKIVPSNVAGLKYDECSDVFTAGRAAMYWDGSRRASKYIEGLGQENLRLIPMPSESGDVPGPSYIGCWALGIPKNSKNPELAWEYIKNFTEAESQAIYAKVSGEVPIRKSAMEDGFFQTDENGKRIKWIQPIIVLKSRQLGLSLLRSDMPNTPDTSFMAVRFMRVKVSCEPLANVHIKRKGDRTYGRYFAETYL
ncbi:extracellular solute-binding protein [Lachnospiraceae bacterium 62-35]